MSYNDDILYNEKYLVIVPATLVCYIDSLKYCFKNVISFDSKKDVDKLIKFINKNNFGQLIFVDYVYEYEEVINCLSNTHEIKCLFLGSLGGFSDQKLYETFTKVVELYNTKRITSIGFVDKNLYEGFKEKLDCHHVILDVPKTKILNKKSISNAVGILSSQEKDTHSFYNSLSAIKLSGFAANILNCTKETKNTVNLFDIKYENYNDKNHLLQNSDISLYVNFTDSNYLLFFESMDNGVPCIVGNNSFLSGKLKEYLSVKSDDSIDEIASKIICVIKNKDNILKEYNQFRERYSKESINSINTFLSYEIEETVEDENELLLSVVVPVYNTEKYLFNCLKSIIKSLPKRVWDRTEILVINDGSTDSSEQIINCFYKKYPKLIKYIKQKNHGLGNVRNVALKNARGKYIASIDSDDTINPNFFKSALEYMEKNVDVIICDWLSITNESKFETAAIEWIFNDINKYEGILYTTIMPSTCNKIIKRKLFSDLKIKYIEDKYEDLSTNPFILLKASTIKYINKPYYEYFIRSNSIMRSSAGYSMIDVIKEVDKRLNKYKKYVNLDIEKFKFYTYSWRIEEFVINQLYKLKGKELDQFVKHMENIRKIMIDIFENKYYIKMVEKLSDKKFSNYIVKRNTAFKKGDIKDFISSNKKRYLLTAPIVYYGLNK